MNEQPDTYVNLTGFHNVEYGYWKWDMQINEYSYALEFIVIQNRLAVTSVEFKQGEKKSFNQSNRIHDKINHTLDTHPKKSEF